MGKKLVLVAVGAHLYKICDSLCTTGKSADIISNYFSAVDTLCISRVLGQVSFEVFVNFFFFLFGGEAALML